MIGKLPAPIAHWDDNLIECYVPEGAALGKSQVVVRPRQGLPQSKARMTVLPREELSGRFKWRLKLPDQYVTTRPVIAPDGSVMTEARRFVDWVKASPPMRAGEPVLAPGDIERRTRQARMREGVPIDDKTLEDLIAAAESVGVAAHDARAMLD